MEITRIGLFGGTFDPVHNGHISMIQNAVTEFNLDKIIIIPTGHPYQKERVGQEITSAEHRINMLRLATENLSFEVEISALETQSTRPSYTVETVDYFKKEYPNAQLFWICGSDVLYGIDTWFKFDQLLKNISLIVITRGRDTIEEVQSRKAFLEKEYGASVYITEFHGPDISSTMIKKNLSAAGEYVAPKVLEYIKNNNLYELS